MAACDPIAHEWRGKFVAHDLGSIPILKKAAFGEVEVLSEFDTNIYEHIPGVRPFMPLLRIPLTRDRGSLVATGRPAYWRSLTYPDDGVCLFERDTGTKARSPKMEKLRERICEHFKFEDHGINARRRVSIGQQFVVPKGRGAIKPDDDELEAEPELGLQDFGTIFRLTEGGLAGVGFVDLQLNGMFPQIDREQIDRLSKQGLLCDFASSLVDASIDPAAITREEFDARAKNILSDAMAARIPAEAQKRGREGAAKTRKFNFVNKWMMDFYFKATIFEYPSFDEPAHMTHAEAERAVIEELARESRDKERLKNAKRYANARATSPDVLREKERLKKAAWCSKRKTPEGPRCTT